MNNCQNIASISEEMVKKFKKEYETDILLSSCRRRTKKANKECEPTCEEVINVFDLSLQNGVKRVTLRPSLFVQMYDSNEYIQWVPKEIVDNYLECLVLKDIRRYEVPHVAACVPTSFFSQVTGIDGSTHTELTHSLFSKQQPHEYDVVIFGGMIEEKNCFALMLMAKQKEVFIFNPTQCPAVIPRVAQFLQFLFEYFKWLSSSAENPFTEAPCSFTEKDREEWTVTKLEPGDKFMPNCEDRCDSGLHVIMLVESILRGFIPTYNARTLQSIRDNFHLVSALASGVPLLGKLSVYPWAL